MLQIICKTPRNPAVFALAIMLATVTSGHLGAQAVKPADDEVITMSAFTVSSKKTNDYVASETVTGTRLATLIKDLPFQVNVVTSEFISDFAMYDMAEENSYVSNFSPTPGSGSAILRGFSTVPYVDGFRRISGSAPPEVDTDTSTIIKGPAASIYGQTVPGGVVNRTIKHPVIGKQQSGIKLAFGSNNIARANAYSTGPLGSSGKLSYRVSFESDSRTYDQMYADARTTYYGAQLLWKPTNTFSWTTRISYNEDRDHDRNSIPTMKNSAKKPALYGAGSVNAGQPVMLASGTNSNGTPKLTAAYDPVSLDPYQNDPAFVAAYNAWAASNYTKAPDGYRLESTGDFLYTPSITRWNKWLDLDYAMGNYRVDGSLGETFQRWTNINTFAEKRWSDFLSTKASLDYFDRGYHKQSGGGSQSYSPNPDVVSGAPNVYDQTPGRYDNGTVGNGTPQWTNQPFKNIAIQVDNVLAFKTGPIDHKLLITLDYNELDQTFYTIRYKAGATPASPTPVRIGTSGNLAQDLPMYYTPRLVPLTWADFWYPTYDKYPEVYDPNNTTADYRSLTRDYGLFISERVSMFKKRVNAYVGLRYDYIKNYINDNNILSFDPVTGKTTRDKGSIEPWSNTSWTPQVGISASPFRNVIVFANYSTAYQPIAQYKAKRDADGNYSAQTFPNEESYGYEFGIRYSAFKDKLNATVSYWYIDRKNVLSSYTDPVTSLTNYDASGEQDARGVDFDFNWVITDSFQVNGNWGHNDAKYVTSGLPYLVGTPTPGAVRNNYGLNARYSFKRGPIKGVSVGGGVRYFEKSMVNPGSGLVYYFAKQPVFYNVRMGNGTLPFPNLPENYPVSTTANPHDYGMINISDGRETIYNKPYALCDFWVKYVFRKPIFGARTEHSIQLNIKNLLHRFYTYGSGVAGDGRQLIVTYSVTF